MLIQMGNESYSGVHVRLKPKWQPSLLKTITITRVLTLVHSLACVVAT